MFHRIFLCALIALAYSAGVARSSSVVIVENGVPKLLDDTFALGARTQQNGYLAVASASKQEAQKFRQHTASTVVLASPAIDDGDFDVSAKLRLVRQDSSANPSWLSFKIGTHYFDFETDGRSIRYIGRMIDAVTYQPAPESAGVELPAAEKPISIDIARKGDTVKLTVDSQQVATCQATPFLHGDLALEVTCAEAEKSINESANGKTELRIYDFRAIGNISTRTSGEQDWRQRVLPEYRQVRRAGDAMGYVPDDPKLPRVLLIGDSISLYYTDPVRRILEHRANIHRIPDNARTTSYGLEQLPKWLNGEKWDVIHFNFGLHDITRTSPEDYEKNLEQIVQMLQATRAQLIWATTTPVPKEATVITPAKVQQYNAIARRVMERHHIPIDDLYDWMLPHSDQYKLFPGNEHFNSEGSAYLAKKVAQSISQAISGVKRESD